MLCLLLWGTQVEPAHAQDTQRPTTPTSLTATAASATLIKLSWNASTDNVGVTAYLLERCQGSGCSSFKKIASVKSTTRSDTGLNPSTVYRYRVRARDAANNRSAYSTVVTGSTQSANRAPVANAGANQTTYVDQPVTLDGSLSSDPDGDPLTFSWSISAAPQSSEATLSSSTAIRPQFTPDVAGTYTFSLVVNDGRLNSAPEAVSVSTINSPPRADAGADITAQVGTVVTLTGQYSTDVDGDRLTYMWSIVSRPEGNTSMPAAADPGTPDRPFLVDRPGTYVARLVVNDGSADSAPDEVTLSTINSPPIADAGPDQTAPVGTVVEINGSASSDVDLDPLAYRWSLTRPANSQATLTTQVEPVTSFVIDKPGSYLAQLIVNDGRVDSVADTVVVSTVNSPPVANAGQDLDGYVGSEVILDGAGSYDVDGDALAFSWALISRPSGSTASIAEAQLPSAEFVPDVPGIYVVQLIVNDGHANSTPSTARVTVTVLPDTTGPVISFAHAQDVITNRATFVVTGSLNEPGTLTINAVAVAVDAGGGFTSEQALSEGINVFTLQAVDTFGNSSTRSVHITRDTVAPAAIVDGLLGTSSNVPGFVAVSGSAGAVEAGASVTIINTRTGASVTVVADAAGRFAAQLAAQAQDELLITVSDAAGNTSSPVRRSVPATTTRPRVPVAERISVQAGAGSSAQISGSAGAVGSGLTVVVTSFYSARTVSVTAAADGSFSATIDVVSHDALFIHAVDAQAGAGPSVVVGAGGQPALSIDSPANATPGELVLTGRVTAPKGTTVTIAGRGAAMRAEPVSIAFKGMLRVTAGRNEIEVLAHLPDGRILSAPLAVQAEDAAFASLQAAPASGKAPLTVQFNVVADAALQYDSLEYDRNGDGKPDRIAKAGATITDLFIAPGHHLVTVKLKQDGMVVRSLQQMVLVSGAAESEVAARGALTAFLSALAGRQLDIAAARMTPAAAEKYRAMFEALGTQLSTIMTGLSQPQITRSGGQVFEFAISREVNGVQRAFLAYVVLGRDGQWRVEAL